MYRDVCPVGASLAELLPRPYVCAPALVWRAANGPNMYMRDGLTTVTRPTRSCQPKLPRRPPTLPREENWPRFHLHPSFASRHAHRAMLAAGRTALAAHCHVPRDRACHVCVHERSLECVRGPVGCAARRGDEAWATLDCSPHPHGSSVLTLRSGVLGISAPYLMKYPTH